MAEMEKMTQEMEAMQAELAEKCKSEDDVLAMLAGDALPESEELSEDDLEIVAGGMSNSQAIKIVSTAYWDLCICKKKKTKYSDKQIQQAMKKCDKLNTKVQGVCIDTIIWGLKKLIGL